MIEINLAKRFSCIGSEYPMVLELESKSQPISSLFFFFYPWLTQVLSKSTQYDRLQTVPNLPDTVHISNFF